MQDRRRALSSPLVDGFANSSAVKVFEALLVSLYDGTLKPGDAVSENDIARRYGVSRTPAREATQRLRELGLVATSAGRTTRVVQVTEERLRQSLVVWAALMDAVIDEVIAVIDESDIADMELCLEEFRRASDHLDAIAAAQATFDLFAVGVARSANPVLVKTLAFTVHVVRLGGQSLPSWLDVDVLGGAEADLVAAFRSRDATAAKAAVAAAASYRLVDVQHPEHSEDTDAQTSTSPPDSPKDR